jgi:hypothetical protein
MSSISSEVIDEVPYASPDDVLKHIRNRDSFSDPGESEAISMLMDRTDFVDDRTNRAWRRREVAGYERSVTLSHLQKQQRHRRRARRRRSGRRLRGPTQLPDPYAPVQLPYLNTQSIERLELIAGESYTDISADGVESVSSESDVEDNLWYLQGSRGRVQIDVAALTVGPNTRQGRVVDPTTAVVTFRYGTDETAAATEAGNGTINGTTDPNTTSAGVSTSVPDSVREAVGKLVAADLARMDSVGDMFRTSGDDLDLSDAANDLQEDAMDAINEWRREIP